MTIQTKKSSIVYQNKWMTVREDQIERESGASGIYGVVEKPDCAAIIAIEDDHIHLVQQYRYTMHQRCWEIPQGAWESNPNADHLELAKGELQEETGLLAQNMIYIGKQQIAYGFVRQICHMYLATDLTLTKQRLDTEEEDLITQRFSMDQFKRMMIEGEIEDMLTISTYGLAVLKGLL